MSSKILIQKNGFEIWKHRPTPEVIPTEIVDNLKLLYGAAYQGCRLLQLSCCDMLVEITYSCKKFFTSWVGMGLLVSDVPIPISLLEEINKEKEKELEAARNKRASQIKRPVDIIKILLTKMGYDVSNFPGGVKISTSFFFVRFGVSNQNVNIYVAWYRPSGYRSRTKIQDSLQYSLNMADPEFNTIFEKVVHNLYFMLEIARGEKNRE